MNGRLVEPMKLVDFMSNAHCEADCHTFWKGVFKLEKTRRNVGLQVSTL